MQLKTAGDLRGFLVGVLVGIKDGSIDPDQANSISKVAAQINSSLSTEIQARIHLKELGQDVAGQMAIASDPIATDEEKWCDQCDMRVSAEDAATCRSAFCKVRPAALSTPDTGRG